MPPSIVCVRSQANLTTAQAIAQCEFLFNSAKLHKSTRGAPQQGPAGLEALEKAGKEMEEELREVREKYRALFNRSLFCVFLSDLKGRFLDANEAALDLLGYTREEFAQLHLSDIDATQTPEDIQASIREVLNNSSARFEVQHRTKNGEIRDVFVSKLDKHIGGL